MQVINNPIMIVSLLVIIAMFFVNTDKIGESFYTEREIAGKSHKVYDVSSKYLPDYSNMGILSDIFTIACLLPVFSSRKLLVEFVSYSVIIFSLRSLFTNSTILPRHKSCKYNTISLGGCHDHIFSGHTASVFLATLMYYKYNMFGINQLVVANIVNMITILLVRYHYTVDVLLAPFIVLSVTNTIAI